MASLINARCVSWPHPTEANAKAKSKVCFRASCRSAQGSQAAHQLRAIPCLKPDIGLGAGGDTPDTSPGRVACKFGLADRPYVSTGSPT